MIMRGRVRGARGKNERSRGQGWEAANAGPGYGLCAGVAGSHGEVGSVKTKWAAGTRWSPRRPLQGHGRVETGPSFRRWQRKPGSSQGLAMERPVSAPHP